MEVFKWITNIEDATIGALREFISVVYPEFDDINGNKRTNLNFTIYMPFKYQLYGIMASQMHKLNLSQPIEEFSNPKCRSVFLSNQ